MSLTGVGVPCPSASRVAAMVDPGCDSSFVETALCVLVRKRREHLPYPGDIWGPGSGHRGWGCRGCNSACPGVTPCRGAARTQWHLSDVFNRIHRLFEPKFNSRNHQEGSQGVTETGHSRRGAFSRHCADSPDMIGGMCFGRTPASSIIRAYPMTCSVRK